MNLLALDTSTEFLSLALQMDGRVFTRHQQAGASASQLILPSINALLKDAKVTLSDLSGIAFGAGPGAFTGVRVACGVAQGLAFGAQLPVVGINTLSAVAESSGADKVIVCQDARMGEVYQAAYQKSGNDWMEVSVTTVCKPELVPVIAGKDWVGAGSGWAVYEEVLKQAYAQNVSQVLSDIAPTAEAILKLAEPIFIAGQAKPASEAAPIYVRNRVALTTQERELGLRL
jgi:tRNA threonylcarbamoyladenosine biosynthesis protein TsaB